MDNLINKLTKLREDTLEIDSADKAHSILSGYKKMDIPTIKQNILLQLNSRYLSDSIKDYLSWVLAIINKGLSKETYDKGIDEIADVISSQKSMIEKKLLALFTEMINSSNPRYISFANYFISRSNTTPLYNQVLDMDILYKKLVTQQQLEKNNTSSYSRSL